MPYLKVGDVDWGLEYSVTNKRRVGAFLHSKPTVVKETRHGKLYRRNLSKSGEFAFVTNKTSMIAYYMDYETQNRSDLGSCATQVKVWMTIASGVDGMPADVFFNIMLNDYDTMISDRIQTNDGRRFWLRRMTTAIDKDLRVGLLDRDEIITYDPDEAFETWVSRIDAWGTEPVHRERRFFITNKSFISSNTPS